MTIDIILGALVFVLSLAVLALWLKLRHNDKQYERLFNTIVKGMQAQREINEQQMDINSSLGQNLEILGVHTKLIPPSIAMQAEAFLAWNNKRKEENEDG